MPLVLQHLSLTLLGVVDTYFVSRVSTEALAAVGLSAVFFLAISMLFRGIVNSAVVFVGRAFGAQDDPQIGVVVWRYLNLVMWLSLPIIGAPWLFAKLMALATPADTPLVRELGTQYLRIRAAEIPLTMFSAVIWGFLVGRGDSRTPMLLAWLMVLLNVVLDWLLVLGNLGMPALGVAGAAYATVLAKTIEAVAGAMVFWRPRHRQQYATGRPQFASWQEISAILRVGLPMGIGDFIEIASFSAFFVLLARLGTEILAATQIALQYMSLSFTFGMALGMAASSLVAQSLGAGQPDRAQRVGYRAMSLAMVSMGLIGLSYLIASAALMRVFSHDPAVVAAGVLVIRMAAFYQTFDAVGLVLSSALDGAGDTVFTMWTRVLLSWGFFLPLVWVLAFVLEGGIYGAWMGALVYLVIFAAIVFLRFRSGHWRQVHLQTQL